MFFSKILNILCAFLLIVCLCISVTTLCALRNALDENELLQQRTEELLAELDRSVLAMDAIAEDAVQVLANQNQSPTTEEKSPTVYRLRSTGENIGVYTADGNLIKLLDVHPKTLPTEIQRMLAEGISLSSWNELVEMIQDITG